MCVCVVVDPSILDRARVATRDRATHISDCGRSSAGRVVAAAVVAVAAACVAAARACVCCVYSPSLLHRAREATRDRATHINDCVRSVARCAAAVVVAVVAACVVAARVCVCFVAHTSFIEPVQQRAIARRVATIALDQRLSVWRRRWWWRWWRRVWRRCVCSFQFTHS